MHVNRPLTDLLRHGDARARAILLHLRGRLRLDDRGEGVISAAIAVLIMAFLGAAMWIGFNEIWQNARDTTDAEVRRIGG